SSNSTSEHHSQRLQTSQSEVTVPLEIFSRQSQLGHATENRVDSYLSFETGQSRTDAIVQTMSKRQVPVWFAGQVELVRQGKHFRVAIGGGKTEDDQL